MKKALFALLLLATPAAAQQQPALQSVTLVVSPAQLELISAALGKQPYMEVRDLVNHLQAQVNQQVEERKKANVGNK